jgi:hypothetical protein
MEPRGYVIDEGCSGLYPMAEVGSGNISNLFFCSLPERSQSATVSTGQP